MKGINASGRAIILGLLLLCTAIITANASVTVSPLFGNHVVLQRNKPVPIYGTASPGENVTVKFASQQVSTTADSQGNWKVLLTAMNANKTAQTLTITGSNTITITDVLVGDVWLCSGQSNMDFLMNQCDRQSDIDSANYPVIRYFSVGVTPLAEPTKNFTGSWTVCSPSTVGTFSGVAYHFAKKICQDQNSQIPIGLLKSAQGGTTIDLWLAPEGTADIPALQPLYSQPTMPWGPFCLFNGMIHPLSPFALKGILWYQGEYGERSNQSPDSYYLKEKALIQGWRQFWGGEELPFYLVMIANLDAPPSGAAPETGGWPLIREHQKDAMAIAHTGMASALDVGDQYDIHPKDKYDVGERLALWALKNEYGRTNIVPSGPILKDVTVSNNTLVCTFDYVGSGLMVGSKTLYQPTQEVVGGTLQRFSIAGADGNWVTANAVISGNTVVVSAPNVTAPRKVAYAYWKNPTGANLYNKDGLPAAPFYVDDVTARFNITATAGTGGSISPAGTTSVLKRTTVLYTITPNAGYSIQDVKVDGVSVGSVKSYTFDPVYAPHTIEASFAATPTNYTVTATAAAGGTITPSGPLTVAQGGSKSFNIVAGTGSHISGVAVDGAPIGRRGSFTFGDIRTNHSISASFACTINAQNGYGGAISPNGANEVPYGTSQTYTITPIAGYAVSNVKVDGVDVGSVSSYTFTNVTTTHTISASFSTANTGTVPKTDQVLFSALAESLPASGAISSWPTYIPAGGSLTATGSPTVEAIDGRKWELNLYTDTDGFNAGTYSSPIPCTGATIVTAVKPVRNGVMTNWTSIVDAFYSNLVLGIHNDTGEVCVWRNGGLRNTGTYIPDGQIAVLSLVVQPTGTYKVYANGVQIVDVPETSTYTQIAPGTESFKKNITIGRNGPDGWTTFNGYIGDTFFYKTSLTDAERQQLETYIGNKLVTSSGPTFTITSSASTGGTISPSGAMLVSYGADKGYTITPSTGYTIADVKVDNVSVGAVASYTFANVMQNHTITASFSPLPVTVTGKVTDVATGAALSGASVYFSASPNPSATPTYTAITDALGNYSQLLPIGTWYGAAAKTTYDTSADKTVSVTAGSSPTLSFALSATPLPGTSVFYHLDESGGTMASDSAASSDNGTLVNGPVWTTGRTSNCISLDGTNDYIAVPNLGDYNAMTISAWVNLDSLGTDATGSAILSCDGSDAGDIQFLILKGTGKMRFTLNGNTPADSDSNYAFTSADIGKWRHVAVVYDRVAKTVKFYINGGINATRTLTTTRVATLSNGVRIGGWSGGRYFDGKIDEFRILGRALYDVEIAEMLNIYSTSTKIADAKKLANGELVTLKNKVVTYAPRNAANIRCAPYFYMEEPDRSAGIMVQNAPSTSDNFTENYPITASGVMKTVSYTGQRYLELSAIPFTDLSHPVVNALGMTTKSIRTDASAQGLLVRSEGKVVELSDDKVWFNITDGYGIPTIVICETGIPISGIAVGDNVVVTGVIGRDIVFGDAPESVIYLRSFTKL